MKCTECKGRGSIDLFLSSVRCDACGGSGASSCSVQACREVTEFWEQKAYTALAERFATASAEHERWSDPAEALEHWQRNPSFFTLRQCLSDVEVLERKASCES